MDSAEERHPAVFIVPIAGILGAISQHDFDQPSFIVLIFLDVKLGPHIAIPVGMCPGAAQMRIAGKPDTAGRGRRFGAQIHAAS